MGKVDRAPATAGAPGVGTRFVARLRSLKVFARLAVMAAVSCSGLVLAISGSASASTYSQITVNKSNWLRRVGDFR